MTILTMLNLTQDILNTFPDALLVLKCTESTTEEKITSQDTFQKVKKLNRGLFYFERQLIFLGYVKN